MARKKPAPDAARAVTAERAGRLHRLLSLFEAGPQTRSALTRRLKVDIRSFYRDLELLRTAGIELPLRDGRYVLEEEVKSALSRLPFPDPHLTLGEAQQLAKGRAQVHRKFRDMLGQIVQPARPARKKPRKRQG